VARLSALRTGRPQTPGDIPGTHFCQRLSRPQGRIAAGWIKSVKNSNIGVFISKLIRTWIFYNIYYYYYYY